MKKKLFTGIILIAAAFASGIALNLLARRFLPGVLPGSMAGMTDLFATLIQVLVPAAGVFATVRIFMRGEDD